MNRRISALILILLITGVFHLSYSQTEAVIDSLKNRLTEVEGKKKVDDAGLKRPVSSEPHHYELK